MSPSKQTQSLFPAYSNARAQATHSGYLYPAKCEDASLSWTLDLEAYHSAISDIMLILISRYYFQALFIGSYCKKQGFKPRFEPNPPH